MRAEIDRLVGVGRHIAAQRATAAALRGVAEPRLLIVFAPGGAELAAAGEALAGVAPGVPVIGCAATGHREVVVAALGGDGFTVSTGVAGAAGGLRDAGAEAAACLGDVADRPHQALVLFATGTDGDPQNVVRGAYSVAGAGVPLVGGGALRAPGAGVLLHGGETHAGGVVAAAIGSDAPFGVGVRHGLHPSGAPMLVTRADGPRVFELDGRPALDAYLERLPEAPAGRQALLEATRARPLGVRRRAGEEQVRTVIDADFDERSVLLLGEIPEGGLAWVMSGGDAAAAAEAACTDAIAALGGAAPRGLIVFDSILRRGGVGDDAIARCGAGAPVARGTTAGQIARMRGLVGFHNQAFAALAIA